MGISLVGRNGENYGLPASFWIAVLRMAESDLGPGLSNKNCHSEEEYMVMGRILRKEAKKLPQIDSHDALRDPSFFNEFAGFLESCGDLVENYLEVHPLLALGFV